MTRTNAYFCCPVGSRQRFGRAFAVCEPPLRYLLQNTNIFAVCRLL